MAKNGQPMGTKRIWLNVVAWLCMAGLLCGCAGAGQSGDTTSSGVSSSAASGQTESLTLAYTANDSLNPYEAKTKTNQELCRLLYDSLIILDENMSPVYRLAQDIETKGTTVTVTLREAYFSDGSRVTAEDVLASMEAAEEGEYTSYKEDFKNLTDKSVTQSGKLELTLAFEDVYFVNFLDFPIYKKGSQDQQNTDNKNLPPIGCGRYVYHEDAGSYWLTANAKWWGGSVTMERIELLNLPDDDAIDHGVQVGTVDWYYYDLQDNTLPGGTGTTSAKVTLPNLVYLGANLSSGATAIREIRMGISAAMNREGLVENAYFGVATAATGAYPAGVKEVSGLQSIATTADKSEAVTWFEKAGYTGVNASGYRTNGEQVLSLRLIYNQENTARESLARFLANQLEAVGCKVTVEPLSFAKYENAIQNGYYNLYIGEMRIPDNFDLYPLLTAGGLVQPAVSDSASDAEDEEDASSAADTGDRTQPDGVLDGEDEQGSSLTAAQAAYRYHTGVGSLTEMVSCINEQLPIIPICHRTGMLLYANHIVGTPAPLADDPFYGIELCNVK